MNTNEKEIAKVNEIISHRPWADDVWLIDIQGELCIDVSDARNYMGDIQDCLSNLRYEHDIDVTTVSEDDYFYCNYCEQYHWVSDGHKSNMVVIGDCDTVCRICLSWAEKEDWELTEEYMEYLTNNPDAINEFLSEGCLESFGFNDAEDFFGGFNETDSPERVFRYYEGYDVIFSYSRDKKNIKVFIR